MEGWSKKEKGLVDMDNSVGVAGQEGDDIRGLKGNGKNTIKKKSRGHTVNPSQVYCP